MGLNVCVFAGQGAQYPGMGKDFSEADSEIKDLFLRANEVLGLDLAKLCYEGPAEELTRSDICQPAIFVTSVAAYRAFQKKCPDVKFAMAAGLSLGEWTALYAAGVLGFEETVKVLRARGTFMQESCDATPSGMVSVMGATPEQLDEICASCGVYKSNLNSAQQVVLSGTKENVAKAEQAAIAMKLRAIVLKVAGAFHSPIMQPAREKLATVIADVAFNKPAIPVLANATGKLHADDPETIKATMLQQVTDSVHWCDDVTEAIRAGADTFIEFGPGKVLSGLIRRIDKGVKTLNVQDADTLENTVKGLE
ncbi:MAG: ACP S-malonyltransferase [Kiritimatiellae bacterium]|nr:ACP S-malonyltransferase [Kiritimatiellia bacterium]